MTDFEKMVIDLLICGECIEIFRLVLTVIRLVRKDWRRKKKDE